MGWSFDDRKCQAYIDAAMAENAAYQPIDRQANYAFHTLKNRRATTDPEDNDRELAAAEHYLFARAKVGNGELSEEVVKVAVVGYDPLKVLGYVPIVWIPRKLAGNSWSRPSFDSIKWGLRGCHD